VTLLDAALTMHAAGLAVIPVRPDGSKAPAVDWKTYQHQPPTTEQLHTWFTGSSYDGLGVVCGATSGHVEMLELEGRATHLVGELAQLLTDSGFGELWQRLCTGYLEQSPSGGLHWLYRVDGPARPNTKLARRPHPDNPRLVDVLIETRGEGGFTVTAPSAGRSHPTGKPWLLLAGNPATIPTLTVDERDALHHFCTVFDQMPVIEDAPRPVGHTATSATGERPGDHYNASTSWDDILTPHGWTRSKKLGPAWGWTRPGKEARDGISATTGRNDADNLFVFSSSTEFETERAYSKFAAYCVAPETRILMADLTWAPAGDLVNGDALVGVDEHIPAPNSRRKLRLSHVESVERRTLPCYRITLADGRAIVSSDEHPWLAASAGQGGNLRWIETRNLRPGQRIAAITEGTWERATDFDSGWLSGMFDGEGWANRTVIAMAQKPGPVLDRAKALLLERGYNVRHLERPSADNLIVGDLPSVLRLLGTLQPGRLVSKMPWIGRGAWTQAAPNALIASVEFLGERDVAAFMTTSRTFIAEGLISHNTLLEHGGDYSAAAKKLRADGYGTPTPISPEDRPAIASTSADPFGTGLPVEPPQQTPEQPSRPVLTVVDGTAARTIQPAITDPVDLTAARYGPTEDGTARALVELHAHELRYCPQRGRWLAWNGHKWCWDEAETHRERIRTIARHLPAGDSWRTYKRRALSAAGVTGIARHAQTDPAITVHIDELDARPYELNTPGGIVDLRTGLLHPPDPAALHTRVTAAVPDFTTDTTLLDGFLATTFGGDVELIGYMQRLFGLAAIGQVLEQILPFGYGSGANGKSTLVEAVMHALGRGETGYAIAVPAEMLMIRKHTEHPAEIAQLAGARLVVCSELDDGQKFAEARVKLLTGRDSLNARFMRGNPFTFVPSHTWLMLGNHAPTISAGGPALMRRLQTIPFNHVVPEEQRDPMLGDKLAAAAPVVLAWIARGAADYMAGGLRIPAAVKAATADYAHDQDTIGRFVDEECHRAPGSLDVRVEVGVLRAAYERWCHDVGDEPSSYRRLTQELRARFGIESVKGGKGRRYYTGITLLELDRPGRGAPPDDDDQRELGWYR
jgi:P4 family phage/plasmid primase-like protien